MPQLRLHREILPLAILALLWPLVPGVGLAQSVSIPFGPGPDPSAWIEQLSATALPDAEIGSAPNFHFVDEDALPFGPLAGLETTRLWGVVQGAGYRMEVPADWNGELVVWAWGFTGFCLEPDDPACRLVAREPWIRRHLIEQGYAWVSSSLSTSGWAVSQGVLEYLTLQSEFVRRVAAPSRVYMIGLSMGGKIAAISNERGLTYDGTLSLCGDLGGHELGDYLVAWNLLAATLAQEESRIAVPPPLDYLDVVVPDVRAFLGTPFPSRLTEAGMRLRRATAELSGGQRPRYDAAFVLADVPVFGVPETMFSLFGGSGDFALLLHGDAEGRVAPWPIDGNLEVAYQLDADPALSTAELDLNARVPRIPPQDDRDPWTFPQAEGRPTRPLMAVQGLGDLLVPLSLARVYAERTEANGASDRLVTRATRGVTHCAFTEYELTRSFDDLAEWVETGVRPAGDDLLDANAVAAPDFGCAWSGEAEGVPRAADVGICDAE